MASRPLPLALGSSRHGLVRVSQEVVEDHQRAHMIAVVAELICREGTEPSGEAIVAEARVSRISIYRLFGSKQGCIEAACSAATEALARPVRKAAGSGGRWLARLEAGLDGLLEAAAAEPRMAALCLLYARGLTEAPLAAGPAGVQAALVALLGGGREAGRAARGDRYQEPTASAEVFVAAGIVAMVEYRLREGSLEANAAQRDEMVQFATSQFTPQ